MNRVTCETQNKNNTYDITIGKNLLNQADTYIGRFIKGKKVAIITDSNVAPLYADTLKKALSAYDVFTFVFPEGEESKNFTTINSIYNFLCENAFTRDDALIALGGGVTGDMCGFAAATYLRGVPFIQIPTTLLSDVDSSVGGKTGYDLPFGKNLIGAFYQPKAVLIDTELLSTLKKETFSDGMAEVIKTALLSDKDMFELTAKKQLDLTEMITRCVHFKSTIVQADELDRGIRGILNLGHTFGHAIEKLGNYKTHSHGHGVAIGTVIACKIGEALGLTKKGLADLSKKAFESYGLPTAVPYSATEIFGALKNDKKANSSGIKLVLLNDIGSAFLQQIDFDSLEKLLADVI